jgi:autophagy-related protein 13
MHQHPRTPPVTASPARSPLTNPMRSNNPRDQDEPSRPLSSGKATPSFPTFAPSDQPQGRALDSADKDNIAKLNQVVQV